MCLHVVSCAVRLRPTQGQEAAPSASGHKHPSAALRLKRVRCDHRAVARARTRAVGCRRHRRRSAPRVLAPEDAAATGHWGDASGGRETVVLVLRLGAVGRPLGLAVLLPTGRAARGFRGAASGGCGRGLGVDPRHAAQCGLLGSLVRYGTARNPVVVSRLAHVLDKVVGEVDKRAELAAVEPKPHAVLHRRLNLRGRPGVLEGNGGGRGRAVAGRGCGAAEVCALGVGTGRAEGCGGAAPP
eukprot:7281443-Prymnesium_polylepis.1